MPVSWEEKAFKLLHSSIEKYTKGTSIPPEWVAGLIYCECSKLDPKASRFEIHVFESIMWVKKGNKSTAFPGFNSGPINKFIKETSDIEQLKALATSYGLGQLMGYHYFMRWGMKPYQFMNLNIDDSVRYTVEFMKFGYNYLVFPFAVKNGKKYLPYEQLMRWHNTGSRTGATYSPDYCRKAKEMAEKYRKYMEKFDVQIKEKKENDKPIQF